MRLGRRLTTDGVHLGQRFRNAENRFRGTLSHLGPASADEPAVANKRDVVTKGRSILPQQ